MPPARGHHCRQRDHGGGQAPTRGRISLHQIHPNPVNPVPGPEWQDDVRSMPSPQQWAEDALQRTGYRAVGGTDHRDANRNYSPGELTANHAARIATLLHFGVHYKDARADAIKMWGFSSISFWIWENSEGGGSEEYMIDMLGRVTEDWHPYVLNLDRVERDAESAIEDIQIRLKNRLYAQVVEGLMAGRAR